MQESINIGWPDSWAGYIAEVSKLDRAALPGEITDLHGVMMKLRWHFH